MSKSKEARFILEGLDCASCAGKIETQIGKIEEISLSSIHFPTKTLLIKLENENNFDEVTNQIKQIITSIEPDVVLKDKNKKNESIISEAKLSPWEKIKFGIGIPLYIIAIVFSFSPLVEFGLFFLSFVLIGSEVLLRALRNLSEGKVFDENFLMSIATIGAFAIGQYAEGVAVMLFYQVGEYFQSLAVNHSRKSISSLMEIRPDFANLIQDETTISVDPDQILVGDFILVKPGEKVPLDGVVESGQSMLDTSAITGESVPRKVTVGDEILSGTINQSGVLTIKVTKVFGESTVSKILELVENAHHLKAPTENFITKFAKVYTPIVVFLALGLAVIPPLLNQGTFNDWIYRALVFLVVSCPCALVISIPLGFFGGIGGASKEGILMKGSQYLEALNQIHTVVFDKTGTLTKGVFQVTNVYSVPGLTKEEFIEYGALAESYSTHPIAKSIVNAYGKNIDESLIKDYEEISGEGIQATIKGRKVLLGNKNYISKETLIPSTLNENKDMGTKIYMSIDGEFSGYLVISDEIKEDSKLAIDSLRKIGVKRLIMLTGDLETVALEVASHLKLDGYYAELLPHQKVEKMEELKKNHSEKGKLVFVGDGINDAPVLALADIGIAMGGLGSDAAIEAADVVIMNDEPSKIVTAIKVARRTRTIVWQNIFFAFGVKAIVLVLGAGGLATMWEAVFADVGVTIIAVFNAMRVLKGNYSDPKVS